MNPSNRSKGLYRHVLDESLQDVALTDPDLNNTLTKLRFDDSVNPGHQRPSSTSKLASASEKALKDLLDDKLTMISDFLEPDAEAATNSVNSTQHSGLLTQVHLQVTKTTEAETKVENAVTILQKLANEIKQLHPELQQELVDAMSTIPPALHNRQAAHNDLLAATIETSLIKLSLMRARCHQTLYAFESPTNSEPENRNTMQKALIAAYSKLQAEGDDLEEEDRFLEEQLEEYENLMRLVDGSKSGFSQLVEDWVTLQKETEECRRDLRRLGWTGD